MVCVPKTCTFFLPISSRLVNILTPSVNFAAAFFFFFFVTCFVLDSVAYWKRVWELEILVFK